MTKEDWFAALILIILLVIVAFLASNIETLFPTPGVREAIAGAINKT